MPNIPTHGFIAAAGAVSGAACSVFFATRKYGHIHLVSVPRVPQEPSPVDPAGLFEYGISGHSFYHCSAA